MANERLPLLRGLIDRIDKFQTVYGGDRKHPPLPARDPAKHRAYLTRQLDRVMQEVEKREEGVRVEGATREVVAVRPEDNAVLKPESLADRAGDVRLVSVDEDTGVAIIDTPDPQLPHLRRKIDQFADDAKVSESGARRNEPAIAPISEVHLAQVGDLAGRRIQSISLAKQAVRWFEIACRGGYRNSAGLSTASRMQIERALERLELAPAQEYEATERLVFFLRCSLAALEKLVDMVDCVYEFDVAGPDVRTFLMYEGDLHSEVSDATIDPPPADAPCVSLLDSGIATEHPMLANLIGGAVCIVPGYQSSPEDTNGHGTEMAGIAAFGDVGDVLDNGGTVAEHWLESARVWIAPDTATAGEEFRPYWPQMTIEAVRAIESLGDRPRVFATAIAAEIDRPGLPTYWSHAVDRLAYNSGAGRLFFVCAGNADSVNVRVLDGYPTMNLEQKIWDPAQAVNALTVGAYTARTTIAPAAPYDSYVPVAPEDGISPHTSAGLVRDGDAIKPDVVFEGGNVGFDGQLPDATIPSLTGLTTGHRHALGRPLSLMWATSEATARAARFGAQLKRLAPNLRLETIRGLVVHSASWSERMTQQFPNLDERLAICGFGVPDLELATSCAKQRATVIIEDAMPNAISIVDAQGKKPKLARVPRRSACRFPRRCSSPRATRESSFAPRCRTSRSQIHSSGISSADSISDGTCRGCRSPSSSSSSASIDLLAARASARTRPSRYPGTSACGDAAGAPCSPTAGAGRRRCSPAKSSSRSIRRWAGGTGVMS